MAMFEKATRKRSKARVALVGPSGSGKTLTALRLAKGLGGKVAVLDSERASASKYAGDQDTPAFDVCELETFSPQTYIAAVKGAAEAGYDVLIIDSLSHAWTGKDGALEQVDRATARSRSRNKFTDGWREVTPLHNELVDNILRAPMHVIVTMRVKTEYVIEEDERGRKVPRKVGLAPVQRAGMEYEFDVVGDMDGDNTLVISKSRCRELSGSIIRKPTEEVGRHLAAWLEQGEVPAAASTEAPQETAHEAAFESKAPENGAAKEIEALVKTLGLSATAADMLRRAGVASFEKLPAERAAAMLAWLKKKEIETATSGVPGNGTAPKPGARQSAPPRAQRKAAEGVTPAVQAAQALASGNGSGLDALAAMLEGGTA